MAAIALTAPDELLAWLVAQRHCDRGVDLSPQVDWEAVSALAERHGLDGVLQFTVDRASIAVPDALRTIWKRKRALEQIWRRRLSDALDETFRAMSAAGIPCVALKGTALAERLYEPPSLRVSTDLDVMIAERDVERTVDVLTASGFAFDADPSSRWHRAHHHHITGRRADGLQLELHFRAFVGFGAAIPSEPLLDRARPYTTQSGTTVQVLSAEDEWLYLAVHAAGHLFERRSWLYDLALFVEHVPGLDGELITGRAREYGLAEALGYTATFLERRSIATPVARGHRRLKHDIANAVRSITLAQPPRTPRAQVGTLCFTALLAQDVRSAMRMSLRNGSRIARRRAHRYFPDLVPEEWSG